jgi:hypothetical protein
MDCAEEKAGPEDVGDQALMRGLDTALPFVRPGLSRRIGPWRHAMHYLRFTHGAKPR